MGAQLPMVFLTFIDSRPKTYTEYIVGAQPPMVSYSKPCSQYLVGAQPPMVLYRRFIQQTNPTPLFQQGAYFQPQTSQT